jgi:hypothetical protein
MIIEEIHLIPEVYQEIKLPKNSIIHNAILKQASDIVLVAELSDEEVFETVGVYIINSNKGLEDYVNEQYFYVNSVKYLYKSEVVLFHVFCEDKVLQEINEFDEFNFN